MNQLKAGAALNYVIIGLNTLVGLLYTPYMLRMLGQSEYGLYSLVASVIAYLTILDFGFGNAIIRYTAKLRSQGKKREQWEMFGMFLVVYSVIGLIAFAGGMVLYYNVDTLFDRTMTAADISQARVMMLLLTLNLLFTFPLSIFGAIITAYENFIFQRGINIARILLSTAVMVALLAVGFKAIALVVVQTVFNLLVLVANYIYCRRKLHIKVRFARFNMPFFREITAYSFWIFLNVIMDRIYWGTGQFVLGATVGKAAVAVFSVAILLQQMYMTFSTSICSVLLPRVTAMVSHDSCDAEISRLFIRMGRYQCIVMAFTLAGFIVFGDGFIHLWAGSEYQGSYLITCIFFAALFVPLIQNTGITILQARNQMKFRSLLYLAISAVSLLLQIMLSHRWGTLGCAVAIGGALITGQGIIMNIYYARSQHIDILGFWSEIGRMLIVPTAFTIAGLISTRYFDYHNIMVLIAGVLIFSLLYIPAFWVFGMNASERHTIGAPLRALINKVSQHILAHDKNNR